MPMETLLTLVIALGVPFWLAAEELLHRFAGKRSGLKAVKPTVAASLSTVGPRRPLKASSHIA